VVAADGSVLLLRRARHETVLERIVWPSSGPAIFGEARPASRETAVAEALKSEAALAPLNPVTPFTLPTWTGSQALLFGDLHMHSAISDGTDPPDEVLAQAYLRGEDFAALTDHDYVVGSRMAFSEHDEIAWLTDSFDRLDGFTTLHAYEWTTPPVPAGFGHRNVYFRGAPPTQVFGFKGLAPDTKHLNARLRKERAFTAPHHTTWTGTDWEGADPAIQRQFEMVSTHGVFEAKGATPIPARGEMPGMYAADGLQRGLRFGFIGGSDGHGLQWHHGIARRADTYGLALTGALVDGESRAQLYDALFARHTLATTGVFIGATLGLSGKLQGDSLSARAPLKFQASLLGVYEQEGGGGPAHAPVRVTLIRDGLPLMELTLEELAESHGIKLGPAVSLDSLLRDVDPPLGEHTYYLRAQWGQGAGESEAVWTSPLFVTVRKK